jgi:hypothetical protein
MILDCNDLEEDTKLIEHYYSPQREAWGQPPASNYFFIIIDDVMYGQVTGSSYIFPGQSFDFSRFAQQKPSEVENNGWLALAESAFTFWDNEQDAIFDNL